MCTYLCFVSSVICIRSLCSFCFDDLLPFSWFGASLLRLLLFSLLIFFFMYSAEFFDFWLCLTFLPMLYPLEFKINAVYWWWTMNKKYLVAAKYGIISLARKWDHPPMCCILRLRSVDRAQWGFRFNCMSAIAKLKLFVGFFLFRVWQTN